MRIGINMPTSLSRRMKPIRDTMNVSQVCREAIETHVVDYERAAARLNSDGLDEAVARIAGEEEHWDVDWEELGWTDARHWVEKVDRGGFDHLFHRIDVLRKQGRPAWKVPPPYVKGVETFDERWGEHFDNFAGQFERLWQIDLEFDPRADAEPKYCRAWLAYVLAVREKIRQRREEQVREMTESRGALPEAEVPEHLQIPATAAERIRRFLIQRVGEARRTEQEKLTFRAGDVHDELGLANAHPNVCQVLEGEKFHRQARIKLTRYMLRPPSGQGANLTIEFQILD